MKAALGFVVATVATCAAVASAAPVLVEIGRDDAIARWYHRVYGAPKFSIYPERCRRPSKSRFVCHMSALTVLVPVTSPARALHM